MPMTNALAYCITMSMTMKRSDIILTAERYGLFWIQDRVSACLSHLRGKTIHFVKFNKILRHKNILKLKISLNFVKFGVFFCQISFTIKIQELTKSIIKLKT